MAEFNPQEMDNAAIDAENDLATLPEGTVEVVADWWYKWFMKTGHKRLGRILVGIAKDKIKKMEG